MQINYLKKWDKAGYCYNQQVRVQKKSFLPLLEKMKNDKTGDWEHDFWIAQPVEICGNVAFPTLTQRDFFAQELGLRGEKRYKDRNTCFLLED